MHHFTKTAAETKVMLNARDKAKVKATKVGVTFFQIFANFSMILSEGDYVA